MHAELEVGVQAVLLVIAAFLGYVHRPGGSAARGVIDGDLLWCLGPCSLASENCGEKRDFACSNHATTPLGAPFTVLYTIRHIVYTECSSEGGLEDARSGEKHALHAGGKGNSHGRSAAALLDAHRRRQRI